MSPYDPLCYWSLTHCEVSAKHTEGVSRGFVHVMPVAYHKPFELTHVATVRQLVLAINASLANAITRTTHCISH